MARIPLWYYTGSTCVPHGYSILVYSQVGTPKGPLTDKAYLCPVTSCWVTNYKMKGTLTTHLMTTWYPGRPPENYTWVLPRTTWTQLWGTFETSLGQLRDNFRTICWLFSYSEYICLVSYFYTYMQKAGDCGDCGILDFPQNFRLRMRNQYCTQAIAWGSTI